VPPGIGRQLRRHDTKTQVIDASPDSCGASSGYAELLQTVGTFDDERLAGSPKVEYADTARR